MGSNVGGAGFAEGKLAAYEEIISLPELMIEDCKSEEEGDK